MTVSTMAWNRRKTWFLVLAAVFGALLVHRLLNPFEQARVAELTYGGPTEERASAGDGLDRFDGMLALLRDPPPVSGEVIAPGFLKPVPGVDLTPPPPPPEPASPPPAPSPPPEPAGPDVGAIVDRELGRFQVIGFFISGGEAAIFLQRDKQVLVVREGNLIDGKYRVEKIAPDKMTLRAVHLDERVHLDLTQYLNASERARLAELDGESTE